MDKIIQPCNPVVGVAYGAVATLDLQIGPRYHAVTFEVIATAAAGQTIDLPAVLDMIKFKTNGKEQRTHTAKELDIIQTTYGANFAANIWNYDGGAINYVNGLPQAAQAGKATMVQLTVFLAEPWRKSYAATEMMAWYTAWANGDVLRSLQVELTVPAAGAKIAAASAITINAYAETDNAVGPLDANKKPVNNITKWTRLGLPYTGAGELFITNLPKRHVCTQITLFGQANDNITACRVKLDNRTIREVTKGRNDQTLIDREFNEAGLLVDQFHVVFDYSDLPTDGLVLEGALDFQVIPTLGAAAAVTKMIYAITQLFGPID